MEGAFNLVDNYFSGLKGQTGLNRLAAPEDMGAREKYFGGLIKACERGGQGADRPANLILPFLTWKEFTGAAAGIFAAINAATDHDIEGWGECGFHEAEFRLPMGEGFTPWQPRAVLEAMPAQQQAAVMALISSPRPSPQGEGELTRARNLSRQEAFDRALGRARENGQVARVTPWRFCDLMGLENSHEVTVGERHLFTIDSMELGPVKLRYLAVVNGRHLAAGEGFRIFINPWSPGVALLTRDDGAAVGLVEQWETVSVTDMEGQKRMAGRQRHWEAERRTRCRRGTAWRRRRSVTWWSTIGR